MFQFGESQKLRLVRILRSTVMVRVGGGWVALDEFLVKNDPCRGESGDRIQLTQFTPPKCYFFLLGRSPTSPFTIHSVIHSFIAHF